MNILQRNGVKAGAVLKVPEMLEDPHYKEREYIDRTEHPEAGASKHPGLPWNFSKAPRNMGQRAPLYAEHSDWVLRDLVGLQQNEIAELRRSDTTPLEPADR
jgi:crotonobetainyl-CoA:carnitine CoA-transferase CaiB-like acyl-CoA transferase